MLRAIIMAGGKGERFWPLSTKIKPKQLLKLTSEKTLIEESVERLLPIIPKKDIFIVANKGLAEKIKGIVKGANYIIEPMQKGTAACIGLAASHLNPEDIMLIETSDHLYKDIKKYHKFIKEAVEKANENRVVLIGIKPMFPHTGLGYIETGIHEGKNAYSVKSFREKPSLNAAKRFVASKKYLWNSGVFVARAGVMLDAIKRHMPKHHAAIESRKFDSLEAISIDYGVIEKEKNLAVIKADMHWDDVGDLASMERILKKDSNGNIISAEHYSINTKGCIILSDIPTATLDIEDLVVVNANGRLLVCNKNSSQDIKRLLQAIPQRLK